MDDFGVEGELLASCLRFQRQFRALSSSALKDVSGASISDPAFCALSRICWPLLPSFMHLPRSSQSTIPFRSQFWKDPFSGNTQLALEGNLHLLFKCLFSLNMSCLSLKIRVL